MALAGAVLGLYQAELEVARPCFALFKMTWYPNWLVYIDGKPEKTAMLSPGFLGVLVTAGSIRSCAATSRVGGENTWL